MLSPRWKAVAPRQLTTYPDGTGAALFSSYHQELDSRKSKVEGCTLAKFTLAPDPATVSLNDTLGSTREAKTNPAATVLFGLPTAIEPTRHLFIRHSMARIFHRKADPRNLSRGRSSVRSRLPA
jgi:hypothetical protein